IIVIIIKRHYSVTCAIEIILLNFKLTLISRKTGPNNLEPMGNEYLFIKATELDPDLRKKFPHLFTPLIVLKITAEHTWPFFTSLLFFMFFFIILFFTTTVIVSPTPAPTLEDEFNNLIQLTNTAPE